MIVKPTQLNIDKIERTERSYQLDCQGSWFVLPSAMNPGER